MMGWRGEPNVPDEPQHVKQGLVQEKLLECLGFPYTILDSWSKNYKEIVDWFYKKSRDGPGPVVLKVKKGDG